MSPPIELDAHDALPEVLAVTGVVVRDALGRVLTVRKRGTVRFMLPGGKPEPGESAAAAGIRECAEEVGLVLDADALRPLGVFRAAAANGDAEQIQASVFQADLGGAVPVPAAEIEEIRWDSAASDAEDLAPLLRTHVFPLLRAHAPSRRTGGSSR